MFEGKKTFIAVAALILIVVGKYFEIIDAVLFEELKVILIGLMGYGIYDRINRGPIEYTEDVE